MHCKTIQSFIQWGIIKDYIDLDPFYQPYPMRVTQEKLADSRLKLEIEVSAEQTKEAYEKVLRDMTRGASIPGFRKGKVPRPILIQHFGLAQIKATSIDDLLNASVEEAIQQEQIDSLGNIHILTEPADLIQRFKPGEVFTFSVSVDILPDLEIGEYTGWELQVPKSVYQPHKVDDFLYTYRRRLATLIPVSTPRPAQLQDVGEIDFVLYFPNEETGELDIIANSDVKNFSLDLIERDSDGKQWSGLVQGILGMTIGETKEVPVCFESGLEPQWLNKNLIAKVTLNELKEVELHPLDDEFARKVSDLDSMDVLRESVEKRIQSEAESTTQSNRNTALLKKIEELITIDPPEVLIKEQIYLMINFALNRLEESGISTKGLTEKSIMEPLFESYRPEAISKVKISMGISEIAKRESIQVSQAAVEEEIDMYRQRNNGSKHQVDWGMLQKLIVKEMRQDAVLDWLANQSTIEYIPETYPESSPPLGMPFSHPMATDDLTTIETTAETISDPITQELRLPEPDGEMDRVKKTDV